MLEQQCLARMMDRCMQPSPARIALQDICQRESLNYQVACQRESLHILVFLFFVFVISFVRLVFTCVRKIILNTKPNKITFVRVPWGVCLQEDCQDNSTTVLTLLHQCSHWARKSLSSRTTMTRRKVHPLQKLRRLNYRSQKLRRLNSGSMLSHIISSAWKANVKVELITWWWRWWWCLWASTAGRVPITKQWWEEEPVFGDPY